MRVMIVGAGKGGARVIEALAEHPEVSLSMVADVNPDAVGILLAKSLGIPTLTNYREAIGVLEEGAPDVVLEVTGVPEVYDDLVRAAPCTTIVIAGVTLRFFMLLIEDKVDLIHRLEAQQRELELLLNSTHDGIIAINGQGIVKLFNQAAAALTGVQTAEALGRRLSQVLPQSRLTRVLQTGQRELNQVERIADTEVVTNRVPVQSESSEVIGAVEIFRDMTELRHMAAEVTNLREVQTLLQAIIQSTQDAISVVDKDGQGLLINPAYTRLTGLQPSEVIGKPANVDIAEGDSMHMKVLRTREPVRSVPMKVGPARREVIVDAAPILVNNELRGSVGVIHDVTEIKRLTEELERANKLLRTVQAKYTFADVIGTSPAMVVAVEQARNAARTPATVLLRGESGTGKELFAHAIHAASDRKFEAFVRVNCAALSDNLLESELFGYEEGAFTGARRGGKRGLFEEASGGTLFLDEIGEMSSSTQAKLLRAIQEREIVRVGGTKPVAINVRLITATHVNLEQAVARGTFREDLYYRLNVIPIVIPPLRYRQEDIPDLVMHIVFHHNQVYGRNVERVTPGAVSVLQAYDWPGNVRELENAIGRAMIHMTYNETELDARHLPVLQASSDKGGNKALHTAQQGMSMSLMELVRMVEREAIQEALRATGGNKTEAARRLGISIRTLYNKMEQSEAVEN